MEMNRTFTGQIKTVWKQKEMPPMVQRLAGEVMTHREARANLSNEKNEKNLTQAIGKLREELENKKMMPVGNKFEVTPEGLILIYGRKIWKPEDMPKPVRELVDKLIAHHEIVQGGGDKGVHEFTKWMKTHGELQGALQEHNMLPEGHEFRMNGKGIIRISERRTTFPGGRSREEYERWFDQRYDRRVRYKAYLTNKRYGEFIKSLKKSKPSIINRIKAGIKNLKKK